MIVPSRSRNTAGGLGLLEVMLEARDQFFAHDFGSSELTHNDRAGIVRDLGSLERRRVTNQREKKDRDRRVAGAGNIEHVASFRRNVMRMFAFLEKHHAVFAERNQQGLRPPFAHQFFSSMD